MEIIRIEMNCPHCGKPCELPITAVNRRIVCPFCSREFVAEPYTEAAQLRLQGQNLLGAQPESLRFPETRHIRVTCAVYKNKFDTVYTRNHSGELFRLTGIEKLYEDQNVADVGLGAPAPEKFVERDFEDAAITCPWCGAFPDRCHHVDSKGYGCETIFCGGTGSPSGKRGFDYHTCPGCGRRETYKNMPPNFMFRGTSNRQSSHSHNVDHAVHDAGHGRLTSQLPEPVRKLLNAWKR
jgi:DNA-directed RNA polymerase subunit RPC12/RpoP